MRKLSLILFVMALPVIVFGIFLLKSGSSARPPQVPDLRDVSWKFAGIVDGAPVNEKTAEIVREYDKHFSDPAQNQIAYVHIMVNVVKNTEDQIVMQFGLATDKIPWLALKVDGKWFVSKQRQVGLPKSTPIKDADGNVVGISLTLETTEGTKKRDILFYQ